MRMRDEGRYRWDSRFEQPAVLRQASLLSHTGSYAFFNHGEEDSMHSSTVYYVYEHACIWVGHVGCVLLGNVRRPKHRGTPPSRPQLIRQRASMPNKRIKFQSGTWDRSPIAHFRLSFDLVLDALQHAALIARWQHVYCLQLTPGRVLIRDPSALASQVSTPISENVLPSQGSRYPHRGLLLQSDSVHHQSPILG
jgi:hypothetical protein